MRIFCLNLHQQAHSSIQEAFLKFTPLIHFRDPSLLWGDISKSLPLYKNSEALLRAIQELGRQLGFQNCSVALADTAAGAQAFAEIFDFFICEHGAEARALAPLSLSSLLNLEGLTPWTSRQEVESLIEFFGDLGLTTLQQLQALPMESWSLRWGSMGDLIRQKIRGEQRQSFSVFLPKDPLIAFQHLDFSINSRPTLIASLAPRLRELFLRLEGREEHLDQLHLTLWSEFGQQKQDLHLSPSFKSRDEKLVLTLLQEKLSDLNFENPIIEWELEIFSLPKAAEQLNFLEPPRHQKDELLRLECLLLEKKVDCGFLRFKASLLPEHSSSLSQEPAAAQLPHSHFDFFQNSHREFPVLSQSLNLAPRPTQILNSPQNLTTDQLRQLVFSGPAHSSERLEVPWQQTDRDYWIAKNKNDQILWIFRDRIKNEYYLHGYFD